MKPIKLTINNINDNEWMRINYKSINDSSHGYYIMKRSIYEENKKRFQKLLKDCLIEIIFRYPVTMEDIIISTLREYKRVLYIYKYKLKIEETRIYKDEERMFDYQTSIDYYQSRIARLERKVPYEID